MLLWSIHGFCGCSKDYQRRIDVIYEGKGFFGIKIVREGPFKHCSNWTSTFICDILSHSIVTHSNSYTPALNRPLLLNNYKESQRRLFLFDYDGTLTPIVQDPAAAIPSDKLNRILMFYRQIQRIKSGSYLVGSSIFGEVDGK